MYKLLFRTIDGEEFSTNLLVRYGTTNREVYSICDLNTGLIINPIREYTHDSNHLLKIFQSWSKINGELEYYLLGDGKIEISVHDIEKLWLEND